MSGTSVSWLLNSIIQEAFQPHKHFVACNFFTFLFCLTLHVTLVIQIQNIHYAMATLSLIFIFINNMVEYKVITLEPPYGIQDRAPRPSSCPQT